MKIFSTSPPLAHVGTEISQRKFLIHTLFFLPRMMLLEMTGLFVCLVQKTAMRVTNFMQANNKQINKKANLTTPPIPLLDHKTRTNEFKKRKMLQERRFLNE